MDVDVDDLWDEDGWVVVFGWRGKNECDTLYTLGSSRKVLS
jgi:hypothetical protein